MKAKIDGVEYMLDKPGVARYSCEGCVAVNNAELCEDLIGCTRECLGTELVWRNSDSAPTKESKE